MSSVIGAVRLPSATPDKVSVAANVTTTGALVQPLAFGAGARDAVTTGAVLSMLICTVAVVVLPALSTAVPDTV